MKHRIAATMLILITSSVASPVLAESGERADGFGAPGHFSEKMADRLGLDDTQRQAVQNIRLAAEPEVTALRERTKANHEKMKALDANDPNRATLLNDIAVEKGQLATESTLLFDRVRNEVNAVLTDEQRARVEEHLGGRSPGRKGKGGRRS